MVNRIRSLALLASLGLASAASALPRAAAAAAAADLDACPGYNARNVRVRAGGLVADLVLAGKACNAYGSDLKELKLEVTYDTKSRIHVKITDPAGERYEIPESVVPRPTAAASGSDRTSDIVFSYNKSPFSFSVARRSTGEKLFDTAGSALVFESQYLRLKTGLPDGPNIYGLGEHTESLRLDPANTTRTLWSRDSYGIPQDSNLYGNHPVYYEHRASGTHAVLLLNSNGMDIKLREAGGKNSLEYNVIGGVLDLYFFAGPGPAEAAQQYAEVVGLPAMMPYWGFGFHQCRYGYRDWIDVAEVIANYTLAGIPMETMWTDIDYMYERWIFTLDPERFPIERVREIVDYLHAHGQHYIVMVDPAIAYQDYPTFNRGLDQGIFLKEANGTVHKGVVWPGVTAFPDWFHPAIGEYWNAEFEAFFDKDTGVDIDGVWIDMNEPASFCEYPCTDPEGIAKAQGMPPVRLPVREPPRAIPGFPSAGTKLKAREAEPKPAFAGAANKMSKRQNAAVDLISPPYSIANDASFGLSDRTVHTDIVHYGGLTEYDTHNLYGTMMSDATYDAMVNRRPGLRPLIITRSTFAGAGKKVGKWLGDNLSTWEQYRWSIPGMLGFASFYQIPMVGSDVCGFGANTTETLCARWSMLGAFNPFYRNHNGDSSSPQEFYRWPTVTSAARNAIDMRYRLLDYIYTAMHTQHTTGAPLLNPLFFKWPKDKKTYGIDTQFLYGDSILVSPVTAENETSVEIYLPDQQLYEFGTGKPVRGRGKNVTLTDIAFDQIPVHIVGGAVLPLRAEGAMTTAELRLKPFNIVIAPDSDGGAKGRLYLDDGVSIVQSQTLEVEFVYRHKKLSVKAKGALDAGVAISKVTLLGAGKKRGEEGSAVVVEMEKSLKESWELTFDV